MNELIPLFPLNIIVFPGEKVNLHIFEPRYKQLINDVQQSNNLFGMPSYSDGNIEYGCLLELKEIVKTYEDGRMDIRTLGRNVIKVLKFYNPGPKKLYPMGKVDHLPNINNPDKAMMEELRQKLEILLNKLEVKPNLIIKDDISSFDVAHIVGLSFEDKYKLLVLTTERERQQYLINHLARILPIVQNLEETKKRISMNGHFRHFDPLNF